MNSGMGKKEIKRGMDTEIHIDTGDETINSKDLNELKFVTLVAQIIVHNALREVDGEEGNKVSKV